MRFAPAVFLSALLLFLMQSVAGKQLLPWFGGAPGTWAACLMFFQALLLAGYGYAWALDRWLTGPAQRAVHLFLMLLAVVQLAWWSHSFGAPLLAPDAWKPRGHEAPVGLILKALVAGTGLPFVLLAASSPLLQRWAAESGLPSHRVYRLYAVSNAGSLIGLLCFPFLLEPRWPLPALASGWAWGFATLTVFAALAFVRSARADTPLKTGGSGVVPGRTKALWILLSAIASAALLATTNQLCQEIAMVPLLWVLPLALYLGAFMLAFHDARWYRREWLAAPTALLSLVALGFLVPGTGVPVSWVMLVLGAWLFLFCWMCLGELCRLRPAATGIAGFYLAIAFGGALGGAAIGVGAPVLLSSVTEFPWTLFAGWLLLAVIFWRDRTSMMHCGDVRFYAASVFFVSAGLLLLVSLVVPKTAPPWMRGPLPAVTAGAVVTTLFYFLTRSFPGWQRWRGWPQMLTGMVLVCAFAFTLDDTRGAGIGVLAKGRNFFGAVRVQNDEIGGAEYLRLVHGSVNHGIQFTDAARRRIAAGYCDADSGVGIAIDRHPRRRPEGGAAPQPLRIGVAGLGVGAMAAHLRHGEVMRFYEINPLVTAWAAGHDAWFTYIKAGEGTVETVTGDARLALERELSIDGPQHYDLLVLDAFSSDSVPVHLLTVEAFALYLRHLRDDGSLLAVNISNRYLDFRPLLHGIADRFALQAQLFYHPGNPPVRTPNLWMIMGQKRPAFFGHPNAVLTRAPKHTILWTDTHSDIFSILR
jgi:hypothetical protein